MRTLKASPQAPLALAIAALSSLALHCGAEDQPPATGTAGTTSTPTAGSGSGGTAGSVGTGGGSSGSGTLPTSGSGGAQSTAGTSFGGMVGGSGGSGGGGTVGGSGGAGGAGGGALGGSGGSGGGSVASFMEVSGLLTQTCKGSKCHDPGSMFHRDWATASTLYNNLTTPIPATPVTVHCKGTTPVVPGNADGSLLYQVLKGKAMCMNGGMMEEIDRMPEKCGSGAGAERPCLTDAQIKLVGDWINAGAKNQ